MTENMYDQHSIKYLLSGPFRKSILSPELDSELFDKRYSLFFPEQCLQIACHNPIMGCEIKLLGSNQDVMGELCPYPQYLGM